MLGPGGEEPRAADGQRQPGASSQEHFLTFSEQLNSRCWILAASCIFICFNLNSCRSERVLTEIIIPEKELRVLMILVSNLTP